ncbi:MAG: hypothetical protein Q7S21_03130 [archaeon]|nr:hypothetical protein [archaeon]
MGWTTATTENADYFLELGAHSQEPEIQDVDAFVCEGHSFPSNFKQMQMIYERAEELNKPIFIVFDVESSLKDELTHVGIGGLRDIIGGAAGIKLIYSAINERRISRRKFAAQIGFGIFLASPLVIFANYPLTLHGKINKREPLRKISAIARSLGITESALRSAFIAEQAEVIAEILQSRLGKKPRIQITSGAGHSEIKEFLEHP